MFRYELWLTLLLKRAVIETVVQLGIGVASGAKGAMPTKTFLENIDILCFERRFAKQNSVIRLKSNILDPTKFLGWLRHCSLAIVALNEVVHRNSRRT